MSLPVAILAGGLGLRLGDLTKDIPKSLVSVCGRPFLAHQLELLSSQGIRKIVLCVGHKGHMIQEVFGDGHDYGVQIVYSADGDSLLGTAGAIRKALAFLGPCFYVLYGDSYLTADYQAVADCFHTSRKLGLMTLYADFGKRGKNNVWYENGEIRFYSKKNPTAAMCHIDYGLSIFRQEAFATTASDRAVDLSEVFEALLKAGQLAAYEVKNRFYEIGSHSGLKGLENFLAVSVEKGHPV